MQAVILAAGIGSRLKPLTDNVPKPLVRINGKPILEYTLSILPPEIHEVVLVVGYRGEQIQEYFGPAFNRVKLVYVTQKEPKGTADALLCAKPFLKDDYFLLLYADDLYHPDDLKNCPEDKPVVLVKEAKNPERFGVCLVDSENHLIDILEKPKDPPSNLVNIGVYVLHQDIFKAPQDSQPDGELNLVAQIAHLAKERPVEVITARFWHPIGYPEDVKEAEQFIQMPAKRRLN